MSTGTADLWLGTVPRLLHRKDDAFRDHFERVLQATAGLDLPIIHHIVGEVREHQDGELAFGLAQLVARHDVHEACEPRPSHRALGWSVVAAAHGHVGANALLVLAHLLDLRDLLDQHPGLDVLADAEASHAIWVAYRCAQRRDTDTLVRPFFRSALAGAFDRAALDDVIARLAKEVTNVELFLPLGGADDPEDPDRSASMDEVVAPTVQVLRNIGDRDSSEGRRLERVYGHLKQPLPMHGAALAPDRFQDVMVALFPWLSPVIDAVTDDLRMQRLLGKSGLTLRPLLVEGQPGTGKSYIVEKIANLLRVPTFTLDAGGHSDNRALAGTARGWSSAQPAFPIHCMSQAHAANPILLVEEVDKCVGSGNGNLHHTLLGMLDRRTAAAWPDECLMATCDLSNCTWILTCNDADRLPKALRSRVRHVRVTPPGEAFADQALTAVALDVRTQLSWPSTKPLPVTAEVWRDLRAAIVDGVDLRRAVGALLAAIANGRARPQTVH